MVARCYWGISLQLVKRIVMVGCRSLWVANVAAVLLGNVTAGFHGGAVLLGNVIAGSNDGAVLLGNAIAGGETQCNGGFQVVLGC